MRVLYTIMSGLVLVSSGLAQDIKVKVDKEVVVFDAMPKKVNGITMVPIRTMLDAMQGTMRWAPDTKTITAWKNSRRFDFVLNSRDAMVNDKPLRMEEAPLIHKNRIYVPIKFLADAGGYIISQEDGWLVLRPSIK